MDTTFFDGRDNARRPARVRHCGAGWAGRWARWGVSIAAVCAAAAAWAHNPHDPAQALAVSPNYAADRTVFVGVVPEINWAYSGLLRSTDGGATWTKLVKGLDNRFDFTSVRVSPTYSADGIVYAATRGDGVYRSADRGASWQLFNDGLGSTAGQLYVTRMAVGVGPVGGPVLYAAINDRGLFRRSQGEPAWVNVLPLPAQVTAIGLAADFASSGRLVIAEASGRVRMSTDRGQTWADLGTPTGAPVFDIAVGAGPAPEIYLASSPAGLFHSTDGGATFVRRSAGLPAAEGINNVALSPSYAADGTAFATSLTQGLFITRDRGLTWTLNDSRIRPTGQTSPEEEFGDIIPTASFALDRTVFLSTYRGLYRSVNGGVRWSEQQTRIELLTGIALSPAFATDRAVMATGYTGFGVYASSDAGATWRRAATGWPSEDFRISAFDVEFVGDGTVAQAVATRNFGLVGLTGDLGASWALKTIPRVSPGSAGDVYPTMIAASPDYRTDGTMLLGTRKHGVVRTADGGATWQLTRGIDVREHMVSVAVSPSFASDATAFAGSLYGKVYRSTDGGSNWVRVGASQVVSRSAGHSHTWVAVSPDWSVDRLVLAGANNGVFVSGDGGTTWAPLAGVPVLGPGRVIEQIEFSPQIASDRTVVVRVRGLGLFSLPLAPDGTAAGPAVNIGQALIDNHVQFVDFKLSPAYAADRTIYGVSMNQVWRSTDGGATWALLSRPALSAVAGGTAAPAAQPGR